MTTSGIVLLLGGQLGANGGAQYGTSAAAVQGRRVTAEIRPPIPATVWVSVAGLMWRHTSLKSARGWGFDVLPGGFPMELRPTTIIPTVHPRPLIGCAQCCTMIYAAEWSEPVDQRRVPHLRE